MPQAALNMHDLEVGSNSRRSNGTQLTGMIFLLLLLGTLLWSGWTVISWMKYARH